MTEKTYLPEVECIITVPDGILGTQVVAVPDEAGHKHFLRVPKGEASQQGGKTYLPIWVVQFDHPRKRALVELPQEADSGTRRIWVPYERFRPQG